MLDFLFKNLWIKLLCVVIAGGLWVYAISGQNKTDSFPGKIPIAPKNVNKGLAPVYDTDEVQIKIMASNSAWKNLATDSFNAYVDLNNLSIGTHEVEVKITSSVPGVQIVEKSPEKILVKMEAVGTKTVRVETKIEGSPADDYELGDVQAKPMMVEARGAKSIIDDLTTATAVVNLDGNAASIDEDTKLVALDLTGKPMRFITFSPEQVRISLPIIKQSGGKIVGVRANVSGTPASGYWMNKLVVEPTSVVIVGDNEKLKALDYVETKSVDISGLSRTKEYVTNLKLPSGLSVAASEPKNIKIKIQIAQVITNRETIAGVNYVGLKDGLKVVSLSPNVISINVSGMFNSLGALSSDNVVANIDLSGKNAGTYRVSLSSGDISTPPGTTVSSFVPSAVTVKIK